MIGIGDKVICINDSIPPHMKDEISKDFQEWIVKDNVYIVRDIFDNNGLVTSIVLEEVLNKPLYFKAVGRVQEPAFLIDRFKKIETLKTSKEESVNRKKEKHTYA